MHHPNVCVYILEDGNKVKIGISRNPEKRLHTICGSAGVKPNQRHFITQCCSNGSQIKTMLKERFASKRIDGEWFAISFDEAKASLDQFTFELPVAETTEAEIADRLINAFINNPAWHTK